ncbi:hypothetical protein [Streptomyces sp. NPDC057909]|uniref:hypothetical protein n=1 Tax=Streptomyces sp. NPDC057909 TaxID=3346277 RepID=UPI0036EB2426
MTTPPVPRWPLYLLSAAADGTVTVTGPAAPPGPHADRAAAVKAVAELAARLSPPRPVRAEAHDEDGTSWPLTIAPDGTATETGQPSRSRKPSRRTRQAKQPAARPAATAAPAEDPVPLDTLLTKDERPVLSGVQQLFQQQRTKQPAPTPAPPRPSTPPQQPPRRTAPVPTLLTIRKHADAGNLSLAADLAAQLDDAFSAAHGPSHPRALEARTARADTRAALGDLSAAISLYRDVAERHMYAGDPETAAQIADRAHILWQQITDPRAAAAIGPAIVRMRAQIPGQGGYAHAQQYQAHLERTLQDVAN